MEKLTLEHLVGYLPFGLKVIRENKSFDNEIFTIQGATKKNVFTSDNGLSLVSISRIKPILIPLSNLANEIEPHKTILHKIAIDLGLLKDDNFIFQYDFSDSGGYGDKSDYSIISPTNNKIISIPQKTEDIDGLSYKIMQELFKHHFDVLGLIEKGLAINYNEF